LMYCFFRLTIGINARALADPSPLLRKAGFELREQKQWWAGMVKSEVWGMEAEKDKR
jgi:hypothetical protein